MATPTHPSRPASRASRTARRSPPAASPARPAPPPPPPPPAPPAPVRGSPYAISTAMGTLPPGNYNSGFVPGALSVPRATLMVTADDQSRVYGDVDPTFIASFAGFKNGETLGTSDVTG